MKKNSILIEPVITEKATLQKLFNRYFFRVDHRANKIEIKNEVERAFNVKVIKVNVSSVRGKARGRIRGRSGRTSFWKKAAVTLAQGNQISLFEGMY
jgi:large subunit ribosomal protein L23